MFDQLYKSASAVARHVAAPYADERARYLDHCVHRGDCPAVVLAKASDLLWIVSNAGLNPDLQSTIEQIRAVIVDCNRGKGECRHNLDSYRVRKRLINTACSWLRYLGNLHKPVPTVPFQSRLDEYSHWAEHERGLSDRSIYSYRHRIGQFLLWYGTSQRSLLDVRVDELDEYLAIGRGHGWCRVTIRNVAETLRAFFRFGAQQGWCRPDLAGAIRGPRIYALEQLPAGPAWSDVQRLFAGLDPSRTRDARDRAILMLLAIYGLRASEVVKLRLDDIDWEHDQLRIPRAKRREPQVYPLLQSVGNALLQYLQSARRPSPCREVFLTLISPYSPLSRGGLFNVVSARLKSINVQCSHHGPHALRHACASRLVAEGLSLKEVGDHLGHRSTSATRVYAKVDLPGLRAVASFDLGEMS